MATAPSPPILIWAPGGGVPVGPVSNPPVYSQKGVTQLVQGQAYIDVVFGSTQTDANWVLATCEIENTTDLTPLNIWPGIITSRTAAGFRLYLNGLPDTGNYYLHWAVSGVNIQPVPATSYLLSGPSSGGIGADSMFTVSLLPSTTLSGPLTVTPNDGGGGGTFTPSSVVLTTTSASATFSYTPVSYGAKTISTTNSGTLINPGSIVFTALASTYTLIGPGSGNTGVPSTNFTVALPAGGVVTGTVIVTPSDSSGGGTFTPSTLNLTTAAPSATFTYTPISVGAKTIGVTNSGGLTNPASLTYTVGTVPLSDGNPVSNWLDSSGNGHTATQSGSARPIYKTGIIGGKPVVRFASSASSVLNVSSPISGASPWTAFAVMKPVSNAVNLSSISASTGGLVPTAIAAGSDGNLYSFSRAQYSDATNTFYGAFHVFTSQVTTAIPSIYVDGNSFTTGNVALAGTGNFDIIGTTGSDGDLAEVILYNSVLSSTDRANIEKYLGTKYGITVAGGTAVDPSTITGLLGWWKADSL